MCEQFFNDTLRIVVSQICQTIGYSNSQATSLEVLQDILHKFLYELSRDLHRQVEHGNRTEANLNDAWRSLKNLKIRLNDIMDYINNVEPLSFAFDIPIYPIKKNSNLNFLKPGSKEVLTRPVHVYEYLPPILSVEQSNLNQFAIISNSFDKIINLDYTSEVRKEKNVDINKESANVKTKSDVELHDKISTNKSCNDNESILSIVPSLRLLDEEGKPTREISSVVMTSGGFLSPAIEGKLPEIYIPNSIEHFRGLDTPLSKPISRPSSRLSNENSLARNIQDKTEKDIELQYLPEAKEKSDLIQLDSHLKIESSSGAIVNNSLINVDTNSISKKSNVPQSSQSPTVALRLLKKAKRKNNSLLSVQGKFHRNENPLNTNEKEFNYTGQQNEKTYKKYMKILQKMTKSAKETKNNDQCNLAYAKKIFKEPINPNLIATMPIGPERLQMEKLFKKQIKHKQKMMKKQIDLQKQILENIKHKNISLEEKIQNVHSIQSSTNLFDIKMVKQKPEIEANNHVVSQQNALYPDTAFLQNILHTTNESNLMQSNQELKKGNMKFNSLPNEVAVGIKLSMEPDRNKLNIFKKISKQKSSKVNLLNESGLPSDQIFNCHQNQVINLPSGTTITPAPIGVSEKIQPLTYTNLALTNENKGYLQQYAASNEIAFCNVKNKESHDQAVPKKRGRKPGSKNQVKASNLSNVDKVNKKKQKKVKVINGVNSVRTNENSDICEPLNLTNHNQFGVIDDFVSKFSLGITNNLDMKQSLNYQSQIKQKDKKKIKTKNSVEIAANINMHMELKVPSKEEVNNINKKLSLIDTELKPELTSNLSGLVFNDTNKCTQSQQNLSQKPSSSKLIGYKKGIQQEEFSNISIPNTKTTFLSQHNGGLPSFPGKMPVMPFYPFSSQPGLIPTPGLFGTSNLRNLSNHVTDVPANMLLTRFLPYTPFKQHSLEDLNPKGIRNEQTSKTISPTFRTGGDLTYCNVAPLIPESMSLSSVGQQSFNRQENVKAMKTFDFSSSSESKEILLKSHEKIKETLTPLLLENINSDKIKQSFCEEVLRKNALSSESISSYKTNVSQILEKNSIKVNTFTQDPIINKVNHTEIVQHTGLPILNINEPIEVSDESVDDTLRNIHIEPVSNTSKQNSIPKIGQILGNSTVQTDIFGPNKTETMEVCIRDPKKSKKPKQIKSSPFSHTSSNLILDVFSVENDVVGKLAGGADLIQVAGTGMAYSSKTIPSTSLTASTTSSVYPVKNKNNLGGINSIKNLSNTSSTNIDLQKKRKEHKKMKKIKEGKIKKKKDKKDKSKNKLKTEKHLNYDDKLFKENTNDKEFLKKCKKGKKKEKQRPIQQNPIITTSNNGITENDVLCKNSINAISEKLHSEIPLKLNAAESTCIVPRLTLKLANCHSTDVNLEKANIDVSIENILEKRELSPELARISPLVTRPPKQKSITGENVQASSIATCGSNTNIDPVSDNKIIKTINTSSLSQSLVLPPSPWLPGGTITASSVLLPQQLSQLVKSNDNLPCTSKAPKLVQDEQQASLETKNSTSISESNRPSSYIDAEGNRVWICPACGKVDDGSAMIGCDGCDAWYHWVCVGIFVAPKENEDWFCRVCITRKKTINSSDKKRKRNKKKIIN